MKVEIQAGAKLDILSPAELDDRMAGFRQSWMTELARGVKFRNPSQQFIFPGAVGAWTIGLVGVPNDPPRGPRLGFIWSVTSLALSGAGLNAAGTDLTSIYRSEVSPSKLFQSGVTRGAVWDPGVFTLQEGETLVLAGTSTGTANSDINAAWSVIELPVQLAWQLL